MASEDMEEITNLSSTEVITRRGQETGLPPAACTGAGVGEHLGGVQNVRVAANREATGYKEDLPSGAVIEDRELAALPGSPPRCTSHRRGGREGGEVEAAP